VPTATRRGKRWRGRANVDGRQIGAGTHPTKAEALQAALEIERKARAGNLAGAHGKIVRDILDRYAEDVSPTKRGARWEFARLAAIGRTDWARLPADRLTPDVLGRYRDERLKAVSGATIIREFNLLSAVFETARREWRWMNSNPLADVRRPKDSAPRTRRLHDGEIEALRLASGYRPDEPTATTMQRVCAAAEFAVETAMRSGEICGLTWAHVHPAHVHVPTSKTGAARDVPLSPRARQIISQMRGVHDRLVFGLAGGSRDALWRRLLHRAGIDGLTFHDLRREATTRLARRFDVLELARITGHRDLRVLLSVYYSPTVAEMTQKLSEAT
jgi:integrase